MTARKRSSAAIRRDIIIAEAVKHALYAMRLDDGILIESEGVSEAPKFEHEMVKLEKALQLLKAYPDSTLTNRLKQ